MAIAVFLSRCAIAFMESVNQQSVIRVSCSIRHTLRQCHRLIQNGWGQSLTVESVEKSVNPAFEVVNESLLLRLRGPH
jgi:hypothetical protein